MRAGMARFWRWLRGVWGRALVIYVAVVLVGAVFLKLGLPDRNAYLALKHLDVNHRLVDGDIAEAGWFHRFLLPSTDTRDRFIGRYVQRTVNENDPLDLADTQSAPAITTKPGRWVVWIPLRELPPADVAALDVHRTLDVCNLDPTETCGAFPVEALACGSDGTCSAGVQLSADQRRRFLHASDQLAAGGKSYAGPRVHVLIHHIVESHGVASNR